MALTEEAPRVHRADDKDPTSDSLISPSSASPLSCSTFRQVKYSQEEEEEEEMAISELGGAYLAPCRQPLLPCWTSGRGKWGWPKQQRRFLRCHAASHRGEAAAGKEAPTYTSRIATDIPLYESPGASFDRYLEDKPRVFQAIFPDNRRSQQLNEEEWRIQMLPIQFLFLTVRPVIDMRLRCKSRGRDYPPQIPQDVSKVLELDITRWELQGLDSVLQPSHFALGVKGALYPDRHGTRNRLKGQLEMSISFVLPPMLALVPADVLQSVAESVLTRLVENMKHRVNGSLLADYSKFKREQPRELL